jgi:hypothetical protein
MLASTMFIAGHCPAYPIDGQQLRLTLLGIAAKVNRSRPEGCVDTRLLSGRARWPEEKNSAREEKLTIQKVEMSELIAAAPLPFDLKMQPGARFVHSECDASATTPAC